MNTPTFAPRALYQDVAELLRQRIFANQLPPGSWIDELKIAEEIGISRTPLREALKVLATEGLVTMKLRRGAYVTEVSQKDLLQVYHLLALLESDASAELARDASDAQIAELQALHDALEAVADDRDEFFNANERFHMRVLEMLDNKWLSQMVADLRKVMKLNRHNSLFKSGRIEESLQEHRELMQALATRDPGAAQACVKLHFRNGLAAAV